MTTPQILVLGGGYVAMQITRVLRRDIRALIDLGRWNSADSCMEIMEYWIAWPGDMGVRSSGRSRAQWMRLFVDNGVAATATSALQSVPGIRGW